MRGTLIVVFSSLLIDGIIPAYAGNTSPATPMMPSRRDHPRVCGEHHCMMPISAVSWGSSPRMRGTHFCPILPTVYRGIIPAYAGNTVCAVKGGTSYEDHPRVCGEHSTLGSGWLSAVGSSPRMRGTRLKGHVHDNTQGISPANAGNTPSPQHIRERRRDHPRVCGEHSTHTFSWGHNRGSSPRMRGTP